MTNVNPENSASPASSDAPASAASAPKLPVRGLAMVLIAVAVMLGMWGLYAMTSDKSENVASEGANDAAVTGPANGGAEGENQGGAASGQKNAAESGNTADGADRAEGMDGTEGAGEADKAADEAKAGEDAEAGNRAEGGAAADRQQADIPVNVYNNSGRANYAADEAERLKSEKFNVSEVGNLSGDVLVAPQTTIYFPEGDAAAENLAKELAAQYYGGNVPGGAIAPYPAELTGDYTKGDAVVVVLAVPQA
ncbi:LytR C-terminal domain-containing protein [Corynebacterium minutissimum]|uniref:LytR C-terminal domain-containing protein n=1 Tax=Corynebacterium minutissimum TaxID=38301 RepID=UPI001EF1D63A|nr:LytR C-terminal domain-containing protein [Corynebacterium minutissimum]MCG7239031.1 LytR C-terminal domain-containing protein [Corynebacterium minutissimum]